MQQTSLDLKYVVFFLHRKGLGQSSGFDSYQFRIVENKFGVKKVFHLFISFCF